VNEKWKKISWKLVKAALLAFLAYIILLSLRSYVQAIVDFGGPF